MLHKAIHNILKNILKRNVTKLGECRSVLKILTGKPTEWTLVTFGLHSKSIDLYQSILYNLQNKKNLCN